MVGIFSRISGGWGHRRTQSAMELREPIPESVAEGGSAPTGGDEIDIAIGFKPVEHPTEPLIHDQPVACPLPEPSILNDGRIWKERISSAASRSRTELPVATDGKHLQPREERVNRPPQPRQSLASSYSAPEHNIIALLED